MSGFFFIIKNQERIGAKGEVYNEKVEIIDDYTYHPFYPIFINDIEKQETEIKFEKIVPAFFLKANEDKEFWHNVIKTGEYTVDVLTTLSGIGNLAKFRYLVKLGEAGSLIAKIKLVAATVEITSGVTNIMLKLTGLEDIEAGKSLQQYLFWLELLSLSGEITVAIKNGLQKSAKEVLEHQDDLYKNAKNADEIKEIDEVVAHLEEVAEVDLMASRRIGNLGGKILKDSQIRQLRGLLSKKGIHLIVEGDVKSITKLFRVC